jgi:hypothetical protein
MLSVPPFMCKRESFRARVDGLWLTGCVGIDLGLAHDISLFAVQNICHTGDSFVASIAGTWDALRRHLEMPFWRRMDGDGSRSAAWASICAGLPAAVAA